MPSSAERGYRLAVRVEYFFDPMCPWAYRTSRWIREVRRHVDLDVAWRFFSLEEVNREDGKKHPWERAWSYGWSQMRVAALLRRDGAEAVDRWYAAAGAAFFERGLPTFTPDGARAVLESIGVDPHRVEEALEDPTTGDEVLADHRECVERHGGHGVPTLVLDDGTALFGPVVLDPPEGPEAVRLWELVTAWQDFPTLFELRRPKTDAHVAAIGDAFRPYLDARAWRTVERPAR